MKTSRTLKRPILLVIAAVLAIAVIASLAVTYALANDTPTAVLSQYQVTMNGRLNLRFIYSAVGEKTTGFTAQVGNKTYNYTLDQVKNVTETESGDVTTYVVSVPLEHSKMASDVSVWPVDADGNTGIVQTYSVEDYAMNVLGDKELSSYHDTIRALLNWGNYSNVMFGDGAGKIDNVFARGTNPASAVNSIAWGEKAAMTINGETFPDTADDHSTVTLAFVNGDVALNFYIAYNGTNNLSARISRDAVVVNDKKTIPALDKDLTVVDTGTKTDGGTPIYLVSVKNLSIELFNTFYTLEVKGNENESLKVQVSVLEYLDNILTLKKEDGKTSYFTETEKNVARSLYQFYQLGTNNKPKECKHTTGAYFSTVEEFRCSTCFADRGTVPATVGYYSDGVLVSEFLNNHTGAIYRSNNNAGTERFTTYVDEDGTVYSRGSARQLLWNRSNRDVALGSSTQGDRTIDIGKSKYLVLKVRSDIAGRTFTVQFSTTAKNSNTAVSTETTPTSTSNKFKDLEGKEYATGTVGITYATDGTGTSSAIRVKMDGEANKWETYVIDLSTIVNGYLVSETGKSNYVIDTLYLTWNEKYNSELYSESHVDFAAFAFVENWSDVEAVVGEGEIAKLVVTAKEGTYSLANVADGSCAHQTELAIDESNKYIAKCKDCGYVVHQYNVSADNTADFFADAKLTPVSTTKCEYNKEIKVDEDGTRYMRFNSFNFTSLTSKWSAFYYAQNNNNPFKSGGRYMIIKIRIPNTNTFTQTSMSIYTSTTNTGDTGADNLLYKVTSDNAWHTIVVDLAGRISTYTPTQSVDGVDTYVPKYFRMDIFTGHQYKTTDGVVSSKPAATDYFDIAYMAWCDDLTDVSAIVAENTYEWSKDETNNIVYDKTTNTCVQHAKMTYAVSDATEELNGRKYTYTCSQCQAILDERTVSSNVTAYMSPTHIGTTDSSRADFVSSLHPHQHFLINGQKISYDYEEKTAFFTYDHMDKNEGSAADEYTTIFWSRQDGWGGQLKSLNVGTAKYLVFKMRVDHALKIRFEMSTSTSNTQNDVYIPYSVSPSYNKSASAFSESGNNTTGWTTYVMDLSKLVTGYPESGDLILDTFHLYTTNTAGDYMKIDLAYIAFVKGDWSNVAALVDQTEVVCITGSDAGVIADSATGKCKNQHVIGDDNYTSADDDEGNTVWTAKCTNCDFKYETTVPSTVNFFGDLKMMNHFSGHDPTMLKYQYDPVNNVLYNNFVTGNETKSHINITGGDSSGDPISTTTSYKVGNYFVVKFRTHKIDKSLSISAVGSSTADADKGSLGSAYSHNRWTVAVIKLSDEIKTSLGKNTKQIYIMFLGTYVDIAYTAMIDSIGAEGEETNELKALINDEKYCYYGTSFSNTPEYRLTENNTVTTCDVHTIPATVNKRTVTTGTEYYYVCPSCQNEFGSHTVDFDTTFISALTLSKKGTALPALDANQVATNLEEALMPHDMFAMKDMAVKVDGKTPYFTFKANRDTSQGAGGHTNTSIYCWNRLSTLYTGGTAGATKYKFNIGQPNYFVIKIRTTGDVPTIAFKYSTKGATALGSKNIPLVTTGEWTTYVFDLAQVFPDSHKLAEGETDYIIDYFWFNMYPFTVNTTVDIAYMAFVEGSWAEIDVFVDEPTVIDVAANKVVKTADGTEYVPAAQ